MPCDMHDEVSLAPASSREHNSHCMPPQQQRRQPPSTPNCSPPGYHEAVAAKLAPLGRRRLPRVEASATKGPHPRCPGACSTQEPLHVSHHAFIQRLALCAAPQPGCARACHAGSTACCSACCSAALSVGCGGAPWREVDARVQQGSDVGCCVRLAAQPPQRPAALWQRHFEAHEAAGVGTRGCRHLQRRRP